MTYFLIDDDVDDQEIFSMALQEADPQVGCRFANDGIEALETLRNETFTPDCIFMDLNMPRMNGNECLVEIRKIDRLHPVPVIMYSTSSDQKLINRSKELGASDFIVKPSGLHALTDILKEVIQKQRLNG
ncbi:MAG: response regulator receiver protein [Sediminibacterium sp.]|nr:response regulator receiver protein [Sediminibacterium sp.]